MLTWMWNPSPWLQQASAAGVVHWQCQSESRQTRTRPGGDSLTGTTGVPRPCPAAAGTFARVSYCPRPANRFPCPTPFHPQQSPAAIPSGFPPCPEPSFPFAFFPPALDSLPPPLALF
jgi:hypothetical protein